MGILLVFDAYNSKVRRTKKNFSPKMLKRLRSEILAPTFLTFFYLIT